MFRTSEKYLAPNGFRFPNLSEGILVVIANEFPWIATH